MTIPWHFEWKTVQNTGILRNLLIEITRVWSLKILDYEFWWNNSSLFDFSESQFLFYLSQSSKLTLLVNQILYQLSFHVSMKLLRSIFAGILLFQKIIPDYFYWSYQNHSFKCINRNKAKIWNPCVKFKYWKGSGIPCMYGKIALERNVWKLSIEMQRSIVHKHFSISSLCTHNQPLLNYILLPTINFWKKILESSIKVYRIFF